MQQCAAFVQDHYDIQPFSILGRIERDATPGGSLEPRGRHHAFSILGRIERDATLSTSSLTSIAVLPFSILGRIERDATA